MLIRLFLILLCFFTLLNSNDKIISFIDTSSKVSILEGASYFIDESSSLSFEEIQKQNFKPTNTDYMRLGYTDVTLWTKFSIKNNSNKKQTIYIALTNPMIDTIELYTKTKQGFTKQTQGVLHLDLYHRNNIMHPSFKVEFNPKEIKQFYYKTYTISCANYYKLYLKNQKQLYKDEFSYQLTEALFFGAMIALFLYNLFIFLFTKERSYFYYIGFLFFVTLNHASYSIMLDYLYSSNPTVTRIDAFMAVYYLTIAIIFALLFIRNILDIYKYKILNQITNVLIAMNILIMIISSTENYLIEYVTYLLFIALIYIQFLVSYSLIKKHPLAKYLFIGWTINFVGIYLLFAKQLGIPSFIDDFVYLYEFSAVLEAILFSIALASRLNKTKELENSLKTNEVLTRELHHRVKNNMQFIINMYRLKLANFTDEKIDLKLKETEGSIQAISKTHEILYAQENLENIDTQIYFENLVEEIKRGFDTQNIDIRVDIHTNLNIQKSIYCGIILNELITNSLKYAFKNNKGKIKISLEKLNNKYLFKLEDDGLGFDINKINKDSFGITFIKEMVKVELKGDITFLNQNGTKTIIEFK